MELFDVIEKNKCTGCMACKNSCPRNAITIIEDENTGFLYPKINNDYCTGCNICKMVCPVENKLKDCKNEIDVYACKSKDEKVRLESSSGGIFSLIADYVLENNGIVFGAAFNEKFEVIHDWIDNKKDIGKFRCSKYLQSKIGNSYKKAREFLENGKIVLYTGTPCQVEGLLAYLRKDYENLYTQDIICHGVPSPKVWRKYLEYKNTIHKEEVKDINFRDKSITGWTKFRLNFKYEKFDDNESLKEDFYMKMFLENFDLRDTCYNCSFKKENRKSDITVADFWGINKVRPEMNDEKGTSAVIINSSKGKRLWNNILNKVEYTKENIEDIKMYNPSFIKSVPYNEKRDEFFKDLNELNFEELIKKYK